MESSRKPSERNGFRLAWRAFAAPFVFNAGEARPSSKIKAMATQPRARMIVTCNGCEENRVGIHALAWAHRHGTDTGHSLRLDIMQWRPIGTAPVDELVLVRGSWGVNFATKNQRGTWRRRANRKLP